MKYDLKIRICSCSCNTICNIPFSVDQSESNHHRGADSGVGEDQVEEEWVSDAEVMDLIIGQYCRIAGILSG